MRLIGASIIWLHLAVSTWAFEIPAGYHPIGHFSGKYSINTLKLVSLSNPDIEFSDLHFVAYADQNQHWVKSFTVQATGGIDGVDNPIAPLFSVEFDQNPTTKRLEVARVILVDKTWDTPLVADLDSGYGMIHIRNLSFEGNGNIRFDLSATLLRLNFDQYSPLPNQKPVQINGHYSGTFPAFALQYPFIAPDD